MASNNGNQDPWNKASGDSLDDHLRTLFKHFSSFFGSGRGGSGGSKLPIVRIVMFLAVLVPVLWVLGGFYTLDAREQAVVLRFGKFHIIHNEGLNWRLLLVDRIYRHNITEVRNYRHEARMLTQDQNIIKVPVTVQYYIGDIKNFVLEMDAPEHSFRLSTESVVRHVVGESTMDSVLSTGREVIAASIHERLQRYQTSYRSGLRIVKVNLLKGEPPEQVKAAFVDVVKAAEDKERMRNEAESYSNRILPETRGKASRILQEAQAYRTKVEEHARGDAGRFIQQLQEYTKAPEITRQRLYLETIEQVMQNSSKILLDAGGGGNSLLYLPLDQLVNRARSTGDMTSLDNSALQTMIEEAVRNRLEADNSKTSTRRRSR